MAKSTSCASVHSCLADVFLSVTVLGLLPFPGLVFNFLIFRTSSTSHTCPSFLASFLSSPSSSFSSSSLTSPPPPPGRSGLAASYLSVKALVPQMPKLLKSLFPARDDKKELRPSPHNQQVSRDGVVKLSAAQTSQAFI